MLAKGNSENTGCYGSLRGEERRVSLAYFMLRDEANSWWDMNKSTHDVPQMRWAQFEELVLANDFQEAARKQKRDEFVHLQQRDMTVA